MSQIFAAAILLILSAGIPACSGSPSPSNGASDPTATPPPTSLSVSADVHYPGIHRRGDYAAGRHASVHCSDGKYAVKGKSGE